MESFKENPVPFGNTEEIQNHIADIATLEVDIKDFERKIALANSSSAQDDNKEDGYLSTKSKYDRMVAICTELKNLREDILSAEAYAQNDENTDEEGEAEETYKNIETLKREILVLETELKDIAEETGRNDLKSLQKEADQSIAAE